MGSTADGVMVPIQAVAEFEGKQVVYVVGGGAVSRREVTAGDSNDQLMQVRDGLADGERVALDARVRAAAELKAAPPKVPGVDGAKKEEAKPATGSPAGGPAGS